MTNSAGTPRALTRLLRELLEREYDAVEACRGALDGIKDGDARDLLAGFLADHERHAGELGRLLRALGAPPHGADSKRLLTGGRVFLAALLGDRAVLGAMAHDEEAAAMAYERALARDDLPAPLRRALAQHMDDERRHGERLGRLCGADAHAAGAR